MPKIQYTTDGGRIIYDADDWLGGYDTSAGGSDFRKLGKGLAFASEVDPLRALGYISPGMNPTDVTNIASVTSYLRNSTIYNQSAIIISGGDQVQKLGTLATGEINTTAPFPHTIAHGAHTGETGDDIVNYYTGTTSRSFFSFRDATDWDVGIYNHVADTFDDDFMSTVPASPLAAPYLTEGKGAPHPLIVGDDDILYMGDRNFLHAYDGQTGANGTFYPAVLTLPVGWIITSFAKNDDFTLSIGAYLQVSTGSTFERGEAKVFVWDYLNLDPSYIYDLHDNYVGDIFNWRGTLAAFTYGRRSLTQTGNTKLQYLNGNQFEPLQSYTSSVQGPIRGGIEVVTDDIFWNDAGTIHSYTKNPYNQEYVFNSLVTNGGAISGLLKFYTATGTIHFSDGAGAGSGIRYMSGNYNEVGIANGKRAVPIFPLRKRGELTNITMTFKEAVTGGRTIQLSTALDGTSVVMTNTNGTITNLKTISIQKRADGTPLGKFSAIQPVVTWASGAGATVCPVLDSIIYDYQNINI